MRRSDSILRNTIFIFIAKLIDVFAGVIVMVLVARALGVAGSGRFWYVVAYVSVFGLVVNLGIDHIIIRESAKRPEDLPRILGAAIKLKILLLAIITPLITGGLFLLRLDSELKFAILLLFTAQVVLRELFTVISQAVFLGLERLEYRTITTLVFQLLRVVGISAVLLLGGGLAPLFATVVIADIVQGSWTMRIVHKRFGAPDFSVSKREVWSFFREALPIGLAFGFNTAFIWLDTLLLKSMRGDYENGLFANAYRIVATLILVVVPMIWILLPHLTRAYHQARETLLREGEFYLKFIAALMFPAALLIGYYAVWLVTFAFGSEYLPAGLALAIVAPTLAFRGVSYLFDLTLTGADMQKLVALGAGTAFFSKLALEIWLIPQYGYLGAAWGTLAADAAAFIVIYILVRKYAVRYNLFRALKGPLTAGIIVLLMLYFMQLPPVWGIIIGFFAFEAMVLGFGTFNRKERENIISLLKRKLTKLT